MGKKKPEIIAGLKQQFIDGAAKNQIEQKTAEKIFELIEYFAGYGFIKATAPLMRWWRFRRRISRRTIRANIWQRF